MDVGGNVVSLDFEKRSGFRLGADRNVKISVRLHAAVRTSSNRPYLGVSWELADHGSQRFPDFESGSRSESDNGLRVRFADQPRYLGGFQHPIDGEHDSG